MNTSVLWVRCPTYPRSEMLVERLRSGGMLPMRVESAADALKLLRQFRAGAVVHHNGSPDAFAECSLLAQSGSPVVAIVRERDEVRRFLEAGCAAVVLDACPSTVFVQILRDVAAGKRDLRWPVLPTADVEIA